jgi:predicted transcriptional regulator of viral defense system
LPQGRAQLVQVLGKSGDVIHIADVTAALDLSRTDAAKRLSRWTEQGWLRRVGRGAYVPVSLDTMGAERVIEDPWVLVPALYAPCYVGGRTAAEHWDLTEQIFNDIVVLTTRSLRAKSQQHHGVTFSLKHITESKIFGAKPVWRAHTKVAISDVHRTVVDMLDDPAIGGGMRQVADCLATYLHRKDRDDDKVVDYAERLGNGAVFKRLGFLTEGDPANARLTEACRAHLTKGNAKLDPAFDSPRLVSRWQLWIPKSWSASVRE